MEPRDDLIDAGGFVNVVVEAEILRGKLPGDFGFGSGPEEASGAHTLLFCQGPEGGTVVPRAVRNDFGVSDAVAGLLLFVVKAVRDEAVVLRIKAGGDGVVIWKSE